jgi:hypothetical protein
VLAVSVLSGIALLTVVVAVASKGRRSTAGRGCTRGRSGDADVVDADSGIGISAITVGIGVAAESDRSGRWCWSWRGCRRGSGADADVALTGPADTAVRAIGVVITTESVDGAV